MLTREENETLCRVGPGTKMGRVMRRYWHPIAVSEQLPGPDSDPLRISLLGERFVAFRDSSGRVGVLNELCMHRGASLALARVEDNGMRCLYHGWKFGVDGTIQETPNHPDSRFRERLKAPCYPVREEGGIVWTYIGEKKKAPPFRRFSFMDAAPSNRTVIRVNVECNYLQLWEGGADSSHVGVLHSNVARPGWLEQIISCAAQTPTIRPISRSRTMRRRSRSRTPTTASTTPRRAAPEMRTALTSSRTSASCRSSCPMRASSRRRASTSMCSRCRTATFAQAPTSSFMATRP